MYEEMHSFGHVLRRWPIFGLNFFFIKINKPTLRKPDDFHGIRLRLYEGFDKPAAYAELGEKCY